MSCADVQTIQAGNGSKTQFSFDFPYAFKSEIHVSFWNATTKEWDEVLTTDATYPWQLTDANPTIIEFTSTAPPAPATPTEPGEPTVDNVRIRRVTSIDDIRAIFNPGSAIRSDDLNKNFEQLRYALQESGCTGISDEVYNYLRDYYWDRFDNTIYSADSWQSDDATIATTEALDGRFIDHVSNESMDGVKTFTSSPVVPTPTSGTDAANKTYVDTEINDKINTAITNDIGTDGTGITVTNDGDGTITLGLADNSIDFDKIKGVDIITESEQDAGSPSPADNNLFTSLASSKRFDTIVSNSTPVGSDWEVGKTWLQPVPDNTLSIWNGSNWIGVASGGTFLSQPTVIYVDSVNGNDGFDGHRIINPKKTIKNAVASANAGDIVYVVPGVYQESLPIDITVSNLSIVGQSIRSCFIHPTAATETETMFRCNSGTYITGFTFAGLKATGTRGDHPVDDDPVYGLPANQGWVAGFYPGCIVKKSPYIQNCTNFADSGINNNSFDPNNFAGTGGDLTSGPTGGGIFVDGSLPSVSSPLRSFVVDSFTQICLDGPGCLVANNGYAQLVSFFGTFCHYHTKGLSGGQVNLTNSTTDFGRYGLIADGKSTTAIFTATANGAASAGDITFAINQPVDNWFGSATRPLDNMMVQIGSDIYPILSSSANGLGWNVTISNPNPANRAENLGLDNSHANGAAVSFFLRSLVSTSGHTFEYAGSGTNYTALPENGGVADELKQSINLNEGRVWQSSTDQNGKFKVGDTFEVDQKTGFVTIDPQSYSTNLVSDLSPQLGGDLDVLDKSITTTLSNGDINLDAPGSGLIKFTEFGLSAVPVVTQHDVGEDLNQIPLNYMLGTMAYQNADYVSATKVSIDAGSASEPTLLFTGDTNTGIYSPGADQVAISTGGTQRVHIKDSSQDTVRVRGVNAVITADAISSNYPGFRLAQNGSIFAGFDGDAGSSANLSTYGALPLVFSTASGERLRITADGKLGVGTSSPGSFNADLNTLVVGSGSGSQGMTIFSGSASTSNIAFHDTADTSLSGMVRYDHNNNAMSFWTNGPVERARITSDGYLRLAGAGIQFNGDTAAANALDDYEEGTWTPELEFGGASTGITYFNRGATYVKVGNRVFVSGILDLTSKGSATGNARITGLPFSSGTAYGDYVAASVFFYYVTFSGGQVQANIANNTNYIGLYLVAGSGNVSSITDANCLSNTGIAFSAHYRVA